MKKHCLWSTKSILRHFFCLSGAGIAGLSQHRKLLGQGRFWAQKAKPEASPYKKLTFLKLKNSHNKGTPTSSSLKFWEKIESPKNQNSVIIDILNVIEFALKEDQMSKNYWKRIFLFYLAILFPLALFSPCICPQEIEIKPATVGQAMPDFTLPTYQGGEVTFSKLKGKNILLIFPRGYAAEGGWCTICNYYYAELVDLEKSEQIRQKHNLEILYVFPYSLEIIKKWVEDEPGQLQKIKDWKYPAEPEKLDEKGKERMLRAKKAFPKDLSFKKGEVPTPFPILIDAERKLSKGLGIFATEWSESKVDQNIPSVYIIDKSGILQFKYIGQNTWDRPSYEYLFKILKLVNKGEL